MSLRVHVHQQKREDGSGEASDERHQGVFESLRAEQGAVTNAAEHGALEPACAQSPGKLRGRALRRSH